MTTIVFSEKLADRQGNQITTEDLKKAFKEAIIINQKLIANNKRIAYFFIDPLIRTFEAANNFYFNILECSVIEKLNTYKSGAGPVQALFDAKELIDQDWYDAVFIFGYDPLLTDKLVLGKDAIKQAMNIFGSKSILECYNLKSHKLCQELGISKEFFFQLTDGLYKNYLRTYAEKTREDVPDHRGKLLEDLNGDLFRITDCANPNIDFAGGVILANDGTADLLDTNKRVKVSGVKYSMVKGIPENIDRIVGDKDNIFEHLKSAFLEAQRQAQINAIEEFQKGNLILELYTCYPPIPLAFLITTKMADSVIEIPELLSNHPITITGGMNFAGAPWNNPALNGLIEMVAVMKNGAKDYGLIHGNGGIGEVQGVAILEKIRS